MLLLSVEKVGSFSWIVTPFLSEIEAFYYCAVEVVKWDTVGESLNVCVCTWMPVHSGEKWQGEERGYYIFREAGRQTPHSSINTFLMAQVRAAVLCPSSPHLFPFLGWQRW